MRNLFDLNIGDKGTVYKILDDGPMRRRFFDLGLIKNTCVECVGKSPFSDPKAYLIRGAVIALRSEDAKKILINKIVRADDNGLNL